MKPATIASANNQFRFTPAQWLTAALGIVIALGCLFVLVTEFLPGKIGQMHLEPGIQWIPASIQQAAKAGEAVASVVTAVF